MTNPQRAPYGKKSLEMQKKHLPMNTLVLSSALMTHQEDQQKEELSRGLRLRSLRNIFQNS